jgi:hypothetical protein
MIIEDIQHARERGDAPHAAMLKTVLKHYIAEHHLATPDAQGVNTARSSSAKRVGIIGQPVFH